MKQVNLLFTFFVVLLISAFTPSLYAQNLLQNGGFENGLSPWQSFGQGQIVSSNPHSGSKTMEICGSPSDDRVIQTVAASAGQSYTLSFWARRTGGNQFSGSGYIKFLSSSWQPLATVDKYVTGTSWMQYDQNALAPAGTAYVEVGVDNFNNSSCVFFDDISLTGGGSGVCSITATVQNVQCNNNGTSANPSDDTYTFDVLMNGSGDCGTTWTGGGQSGAYGTTASFGPFPISGGNRTLSFDDAYSGAIVTVTATAPATCSGGSTGGCSNNLLKNANFSANGSDWGQSGAVTFISGSASYAGTSTKLSGNADRIFQAVPAQAGKTYTFQGQVKRSGSATGLMIIKYLNASWTPIAQEFNNISNNNYALQSMSLASPTGTAYAEVAFFHNGGSGAIFGDDFCFSDGSSTGGSQADLTVSNLTIATSGSATAGDVIDFAFDLQNIGNALADGNFTIKSYISTDQTLSSDDIQDGTIPTGFVGPGQSILQSPGALRLPSTLADGAYYIILKVDADEQISESNEGNNVTVSSTTLTVSSGTSGGCGFQSCSTTPFLSVFNRVPDFTTESSTDFQFQVGSLSANTYTFQKATIDKTGAFQGTPSQFVKNVPSGRIIALKDGNFLNYSIDLTASTVRVQKETASGTVLWNNVIPVTVPTLTTGVNLSASEMPNGGFLISGAYQRGSLGHSIPFLLKLSGIGLNQAYKTLPSENSFTLFVEVAGYGSGNSIYLYITDNDTRSMDILKVNSALNQQWRDPGEGDLVSTRIQGFVESGNNVYFAFQFTPVAFLRRINATTGTRVWTKNMDTVSPSGFLGFETNRHTLGLVADGSGGVVGALTRNNNTGDSYIIYNVRPNESVKWSLIGDPGASLSPQLRTSDGGFLFIGTNAADQICALKVTSSGSLTPACSGGGTSNADLELSLSATPQNPGQWKSTTITLTATNTGSVSASGLKIATPATKNAAFGDQLALVTSSTSNGSYYDPWNGVWHLNTLGAGQSVTLTYEGFTKIAGPIAFFCQVSEMSEPDADSAPGNNTSGTPSEDDEAVVVLNSTIAFVQGDAEQAEIPAPEVAVFPNPAARFVRLDLSNYEGKSVDLALIDAFGRVVLQKNNLTETLESVDLEAIENGLYHLQLRSAETRPVVMRLVVERGF